MNAADWVLLKLKCLSVVLFRVEPLNLFSVCESLRGFSTQRPFFEDFFAINIKETINLPI